MGRGRASSSSTQARDEAGNTPCNPLALDFRFRARVCSGTTWLIETSSTWVNFARPRARLCRPALFVRSVPRRNHQKVSLSSPYVHLGEVVFPRSSSYIIHLFSRQPAKMAARPTVTVYAASGEASGSLALPSVFTAPIRLDVVQQVHSESKE